MSENDVTAALPNTRMCLAGNIGELRAMSATAGPPFFSDKPPTAQIVASPAVVDEANKAISANPNGFPKDAGGRIGVEVGGFSGKADVKPFPKACPPPLIG